MSILGAVLGGAISAFGASKAAKAQERASREQIALAKETRDMTRADLAPYTQAGLPAVNALMFELGLGPRPSMGGSAAPQIETITTQGQAGQGSFGDRVPYGFNSMDDYLAGRPAGATTQYRVGDRTFGTMEEAQAFANSQAGGGTPYAGISMSPSANFLLQEGRDTIEAGAASGGGLYSGSTLQGLEDYRQNVALSDRENQMNRLFQMTGIGQAGAAGTAAANQNYAGMAGNALANRGNAQAAGYIGMANAANNTIGNVVGMNQFNRLLNYQGGLSGGSPFAKSTPGMGGLY